MNGLLRAALLLRFKREYPTEQLFEWNARVEQAEHDIVDHLIDEVLGPERRPEK